MGFNPTFYASRPKLSEVTIDSDLNMGEYGIQAAEILCESFESEAAQFVNPVLVPYTVVPSDSVLYESDMSATRTSWNYETIGAIKIGTARPNSCAFTLKWTVTIEGPDAQARIRILRNGNLIAETPPLSGGGGDYEQSYILPALSGGDVLTFQGAGRVYYTATFKDFKLCGTVITGLIDAPTFEDAI